MHSFGILTEHHFVVTISKRWDDEVTVFECFGTERERIRRVEIAREKWNEIADAVKADFNLRLKKQKQKSGSWGIGDNHVERTLGLELMVLLWAIEDAALFMIKPAILNWSGLQPEERWWLYTTTNAATGRPADHNRGWRVALRHALTENPTS